MRYKEHEVLDIIKSCSELDPVEALSDWNKKKANTPLDLSEWNYPYFIYTFPIIVKEEEVGSITVCKVSSANLERDEFMQKYFGHKDYEKCYWTFSHYSYLDCYLLINKEFELPEIVKGFYGKDFIGKNAEGNEFEFTITYGHPSDEDDEYTFDNYTFDNHEYTTYSFDSGINIKIQNIEAGWSLGEKINENIKNRSKQE